MGAKTAYRVVESGTAVCNRANSVAAVDFATDKAIVEINALGDKDKKLPAEWR